MKKPKIELSVPAIKNFFFRHTEKLFFALSVGLIALFFWMGFKTPSFDLTTPTAMLQTAEKAGARMADSSNWSKMAEYRKPILDAADRIQNTAPVEAAAIGFRPITGTGIRTLEKRTDPAFLKPGPLVISYFRSQVAAAMKTDDSKTPTRASALDRLPTSDLVYPPNQKGESFIYRGSGLEGQPIATVDVVVGMALIDYEAQLLAYRETFQYQRGYDVNRDVPEFRFMEIQRKTDTSDWVPISAKIVESYEKMNGIIQKDLIKSDLSIPNVTMDIPPFLGLDYRDLVTLPEIEVEKASDYAPEIVKEETANDQEPIDPNNLFDSSDDAAKADGPTAAKSDDVAKNEVKISKYRLIRFFDLETKPPGVEYYYRVRIWFKDPNNPDNFDKNKKEASNSGLGKGGVGKGGGGAFNDDLPGGSDSGGDTTSKKALPKVPLLLDDISPEVRHRLLLPIPEVAGLPKWVDEQKDAVLRTVIPGEWIESTVPVKANKGFETFVAGPVTAPTPNRVGSIDFYSDEPKATIVANSFQNDLNVFVPAVTTKTPGSVLNFRAVAHVLHPLLWQVREVFESTDARGQKSGRLFETDSVLVDVIGGQRQPFSKRPDTFYTPAEIMVLDRNGRLIIRNDLDDETAYRHSIFDSQSNRETIEGRSGKKPPSDDDDELPPGQG